MTLTRGWLVVNMSSVSMCLARGWQVDVIWLPNGFSFVLDF